ncbi:MAG: 3'-5' exonuclease, partial [Nocardioidaceae bacterium]
TDAGSSDITGALQQAVAGVDAADVVSLLEALEDPGPDGYSEQARDRFGALASELRLLRRHAGEPLLELVRRVIEVTGLEVELASSTSPVAAARRDNVSTFLDAVATFAGVDNEASLTGLLAYLKAEDEFGQGLSLALPSSANSVKLLTVHRAKGMEWDVVFVPGVSTKVFPNEQGRSRWTGSAGELPTPLRGDYADLPKVGERSGKGLTAYAEQCRDHALLEELRLAYVALTRPREMLIVSAHWWGAGQKRPRGPSVVWREVASAMRSWGDKPERDVDPPAADAENPSNRADRAYPWPVEAGADEVARRRAGADLVGAASEVGWEQAQSSADDGLMLDEAARVTQWDAELDRLLDEARSAVATEIGVPLPSSLSATAMLRLQDDPDGLARDLARPMPRRPSPSARFGTRFHAWVEAHVGQQPLLDPDDLPGRADSGIDGDDDLHRLIDAFRAGPFADRIPHSVEASFALALGGHVVRGRIDAVYETEGGFLIVDWKTGQRQTADPLQLAVYRVAWAELHQIDPIAVKAAFYYVRTGELVCCDDLPDRAELERLIAPSS